MGPFFAFACFGAAFGLIDREIHVFERAAAAEIRSSLSGEQASVKVRVEPDGIAGVWGSLHRATITASDFAVDGLPFFTEPERSKAGRCGTLVLDLREFSLGGLRVESLRSEIPACRYDFGLALRKKTFRLSRSGVGRGTVRIRESDLSAFILQKFREIKRVTVKVYNGVVWVEGYGEFLVVTTPFTVIATLKPVDGTKLVLDDARVWFDWRRADAFAAETLLKTLNPVVDLQTDLGLLDAVKVDSIKLEDGVLEASGATKIPVRPATGERRARLDERWLGARTSSSATRSADVPSATSAPTQPPGGDLPNVPAPLAGPD